MAVCRPRCFCQLVLACARILVEDELGFSKGKSERGRESGWLRRARSVRGDRLWHPESHQRRWVRRLHAQRAAQSPLHHPRRSHGHQVRASHAARNQGMCRTESDYSNGFSSFIVFLRFSRSSGSASTCFPATSATWSASSTTTFTPTPSSWSTHS